MAIDNERGVESVRVCVCEYVRGLEKVRRKERERKKNLIFSIDVCSASDVGRLRFLAGEDIVLVLVRALVSERERERERERVRV